MTLGWGIVLGAFVGVAVLTFFVSRYFGWIECKEGLSDTKNLLLGLCWPLVLGLSTALLLGLIMFYLDSENSAEGEEVVESYSIEAMKGDSRNPCFVAFSATSMPTYSVLRKTDDGGYVFEQFFADKTTLYEVDTDFHVEVLEVFEYVDQTQSLFFPTAEVQYRVPKLSCSETIYKVYIPKGSIVGGSYDTGWNGSSGADGEGSGR